MTIYRRILKVKTVGSRREGNLRPAISDRCPRGINYVVHEYNEDEGWCIIEAWCSDHPILPTEHQKDASHLEELAADPDVIQTIEKHPLSPPVLGRISYGSPASPKKVDLTAKTITVEVRELDGRIVEKTVSFKRVEKERTTRGTEYDNYILDEG